MVRRKPGRLAGGASVNMAAMIDVVFLLLVFFVLTVRPRDVEAKLPASQTGRGEVAIPLVSIDVYRDVYMMNGRRVTLSKMDSLLGKLAGIHDEQGIVVTCARDSSHARLIKVLDLCAKSDLQNVSLRSR